MPLYDILKLPALSPNKLFKKKLVLERVKKILGVLKNKIPSSNYKGVSRSWIK